jgi:hypothetical protein
MNTKAHSPCLTHHLPLLLAIGLGLAVVPVALHAQDAGRAERQRKPEAELKERDVNPERIEARIRELVAEGKTDEAEKLKQQLLERRGQAGREQERGELAEIKQRHILLLNEAIKLRNQGRADEAERLEQEARQIHARLEASMREGGRRPDKSPGTPEAEEMQRKARHMRAAAENLRAAGVHDAAEEIARQAAHIEQELHKRAGAAGEARDGQPMIARELQEQVRALQNEVRELRRQVEALSKERR